MSEKQKTIQKAAIVSGTGLHTGKQVTMRFVPAPVNHGYKFKRIDLPDNPLIDADIDNVFDTSRGTSIKQNDAEVRTVEHALAAVCGLGIDNIMIEIDGPETPILDGSAKLIIEALAEAGIQEQNENREYFELPNNIYYSDHEKKIDMIALPAKQFSVSVMIDFETDVLNTQNAVMHRIEDFREQIADCRTFVFLHELELLIKNGLIKGGGIDNAIVFVNRLLSKEKLDSLAEFFNRPKVEVLQQGILNNVELRHPNEPARHKLLDIVGDLALIGKPIKAKIIASRPGHASNIVFAKKIKQLLKQDEINKKIPKFDLTAAPVYNINDIKRILPHRYPFLLVDKIIDIGTSHVVGVKNLTFNEHFFQGHFPDEPVMPGVLQIEAMAQVGGILVLSTVPDPENYSTYFVRIENVRFKQKVVPGDTIIFKLDLVQPVRRGICMMKGVGIVGNKIVIEAEMMAQITKTSNK